MRPTDSKQMVLGAFPNATLYRHGSWRDGETFWKVWPNKHANTLDAVLGTGATEESAWDAAAQHSSVTAFWDAKELEETMTPSDAPKRSLHDVLEELCPGVGERNRPAWAVTPLSAGKPSEPYTQNPYDEEPEVAPVTDAPGEPCRKENAENFTQGDLMSRNFTQDSVTDAPGEPTTAIPHRVPSGPTEELKSADALPQRPQPKFMEGTTVWREVVLYMDALESQLLSLQAQLADARVLLGLTADGKSNFERMRADKAEAQLAEAHGRLDYKNEEVNALNEALTQVETQLAEVTKERDEAREAVSLANNSLWGSLGYFLSSTGGKPDKYFLANGIEERKSLCRKANDRAEAGEAKLLSERSRAELAEAQLLSIKEWWRTNVGDGADNFTLEGLESLIEDYRFERSRVWEETIKEYCIPGDMKPMYVLRFDDPDVGEMVFDSKEAARAAWEKYNPRWNCWLFAPMEVVALSASQPKEEL